MVRRDELKSDPLSDIVRRHRGGESIGITAVCSAHPLVIEAAMREAAADAAGPVLIEATSNQVDQTGGYSGLRPNDFRDLVLRIAGRCGVPAGQVILGGDHLGPNRWRDLPPEEAMSNADELVAAYVTAGFTKIHLDCSMPCVGDPAVLSDELVSERAARLLRIAEDRAPQPTALSYVIGTEVPAPGGAQEAIGELIATSSAAAQRTLEAHRRALAAAGLQKAWPRIRALVVQPGVEFDEWNVVDYDRRRTTDLQRVLADEPDMVFEAHSTDFQTSENLGALVQDHWAVLKVGPGLTFALREALFALAAIEVELCNGQGRSRLIEVLEERMLADPQPWIGYYAGDSRAQRMARRYSLSDRLRYFWPDPIVAAAEEQLLENLARVKIPLPLLSQFLPIQYERVRRQTLEPDPRALVLDHITDVLRAYRRACAGGAALEESRRRVPELSARQAPGIP